MKNTRHDSKRCKTSKMRKLYILVATLLFSSVTYAQTPETARERMNEGKYLAALNYWEALNDDYNKYWKEIQICKSCNALQQEALQFIRTKQYTDAIDKYNEIILLNPHDKNARRQIEHYQQLFDETTAIYYSNTAFGYSISYPPYLKQTSRTFDKVHFASEDKYNIQLRIEVKKEYGNLSTPVSKLLKTEVETYLTSKKVNKSTITVNLTKNNWMVVSGKYPNGDIFYNKTYIITKKSSTGQYYRTMISAVAISSPKDKRGNQLANCIAKSFIADTGTYITDESIWSQAKERGTIEAYQNYLDISGVDGKHRTEAQAIINLLSARENYYTKQYQKAKHCYELAKSYYNLGTDDTRFYMTACEEVKYEQLNNWYNRTNLNLSQLLKFRKDYPNSAHLPEVNGLIVKAYCQAGDFAAAQRTVDDYWPDILTPETQSRQSKSFWKGIIRQYKKQYKTTQSNSNRHKSSGRRQEKSSVGHMWEFGMDWRCNGKSYWGVNTAFCIGTLEKRFNLDFRVNPSVTFSKNLDKQLYPKWFCPIMMGTRLYLNPGHGEDWFCYVEPEVGYSINASGVFGGRFVFGYGIVGVNIGGLWTMSSMPYNETNSRFVYAGIGINVYLW